jgi:hypothetical protein
MSVRKPSDSNLTGKRYNDASAGNTKIPDVPDLPTIGTVTVDGGTASVPMTAAATGGLPSLYRVISNPGSISATSSSSPVSVSGLTAGTSYTFTGRSENATGNSAYAGPSNSVTAAVSVQYLVLAGGGSGGRGGRGGGGGGAGGYRESSLGTILLSTNYTVTVGAGGTFWSSGSASQFANINSTGGGSGGSDSYNTWGVTGTSGGSGGGGSGADSNGASSGGSPTSGQGYAGGGGGSFAGGGGGGAAGAGNTGSGGNPGNGGSAITSNILGVAKAGGGGASQVASNGAGGSGGGGGAGNGSNANGTGNAATANSGSGGGASSSYNTAGTITGGSGVVALKYPDTYTITIGAGLTGTTAAPSGGYKVTTITAGTGTVSWT